MQNATEINRHESPTTEPKLCATGVVFERFHHATPMNFCFLSYKNRSLKLWEKMKTSEVLHHLQSVSSSHQASPCGTLLLCSFYVSSYHFLWHFLHTRSTHPSPSTCLFSRRQLCLQLAAALMNGQTQTDYRGSIINCDGSLRNGTLEPRIAPADSNLFFSSLEIKKKKEKKEPSSRSNLHLPVSKRITEMKSLISQKHARVSDNYVEISLQKWE